VNQAERIRGDGAAPRETSPPIVARPAGRPSPARSPLDGRCATLLSRRRIQPALRVSSASDPAEREAERIARAVVSMPDPMPGGSARAANRSPLLAARAPAVRGAAGGGVDSAVEARIRQSASGGTLLPRPTRAFLEPRFRADFGGVRIHTDANAATLTTRLGARAFTFGRHIFFNEGQYRPDTQEGMELLAHELTHSIQQSEVVQRQVETAGEAPRVSERTELQASRLGLSDALDYFAGAANAIPGFRMFTILIGFNPINRAHVQASAANILRAIVEFLPGGPRITGVLDSYGIFDRVGSWIEAQLRTLGISGAAIRAALDRFLGSLRLRDIFDLDGVWRRARAIFADPAGRLVTFARSLFGEIMGFVRTAVLRPLARLAEGTRGYPLLKAVLGQDPVTGEPFPRTAETVIGGFLTLIGQQELWRNIQRANAIPRAWTWFQGALGGLTSLVRGIPDRFMAALRGLEIMDFVILPRAFAAVARTFGSFLADFGAWALGTVFDLLRIIIEVVKPEILPYLRRAAGAFNTIVRDPVRFVRTLVRAAIQGFRQFAANFLTHLRASLVGWLTGAMAGANIYIPQAFSLREILKFTLSVLGLTWANLRSRLVRATSETVVAALETGFEIVRTLVAEGPAAAWQKILETLGNLRDMVIGQVMTFVRSRIVDAAVTRLLSMLTPAGALIQAIVAIYNTMMFFVERLSQIGRVAASFIDSIATIAAGDIAPAANRVERTMAGMLTLVISFLARIAGLGRVGDEVSRIVNRIRQSVDGAFDRVVAWIVEQARRLGGLVVTSTARRAIVRPDGADDERSRAVKAHVRQALSGRTISDRNAADSLIGSTYSRFTAEGLQGLRTRVDLESASPQLIVLANASATEEVARLPLTSTGLNAALDYVVRFSFKRGTTVLQVYYDQDNKRFFERIENEPELPGRPHAEEVFVSDHLQGLVQTIRTEHAAGHLLTPAGQPVRIEMNLNRLPCQGCSHLMARVARQYPDIRFLVRASSVSNSDSASRFVTSESEMHIQFVRTMIEANIDVQPLPIFEAVYRRFLDYGVGRRAGTVPEIKFRGDTLWTRYNTAQDVMNAGKAETIKVRDLIENARTRIALGRVPPRGRAP
jgi:hypothetical protein